ncbi:60S ribosomal protein L1 [Dictyocoela muelleri]|nr:60S ribosomal protein L1 [Dictyocoela muelleri]
MSNSELEGKSKEKQKLKKKIAMKYDSFISIPAFNSIFEMKMFNRKRKPIYIVKNPTDLPLFYKDVERTVKFKLRKTCDLAFTIGYVGMKTDEILANYNAGIQGLVAVLKKGTKNLGGIFMKSCQGSSVKVY